MEEKDKGTKRKFIKIPQTKTTVKQNFILGVGLVLVLVGLFMLVRVMSSSARIFTLRPIILLCIGVILIFMALAFTRNSVFVFLGIDLILCGIMTLLMDSGIIPLKMKELWPTIVIASGLSFLPAGLYKLKRIRITYLFPAIALVVLGILFLLFSLHIIPFSLTKFIAVWWPLVIITGGIVLVVLFFLQQYREKNFPTNRDYSLDDDDDDDDENDDDENGKHRNGGKQN